MSHCAHSPAFSLQADGPAFPFQGHGPAFSLQAYGHGPAFPLHSFGQSPASSFPFPASFLWISVHNLQPITFKVSAFREFLTFGIPYTQARPSTAFQQSEAIETKKYQAKYG